MKKLIVTIIMTIVAISGDAQNRYCNTYEDFLEGKWQQLDTINCKSHSKSRQVWWGGSDYTLTTGDKELDNVLKKKAFAVMIADTLYLNCRNLRYEKTSFGGGYSRARRMGENSLLLVHRVIGKSAQKDEVLSSLVFGVVGEAITSNKQVKQQVCYVISNGANEKGRINIQMINDSLMNQMVQNREDLRKEYYAEENKSKRLLATHIVPILEKAGLFEQPKKKGTEKKK